MNKMPARYDLLILPKPAMRLPADCDLSLSATNGAGLLLDAGGHWEDNGCAPPLPGRI
jgi:hypothetical protein